MANTYTWVISQLDCYPQKDDLPKVVFIVHWRRKASDGKGHTASIYGAQNIILDPDTPFTPYENLTFSQVIEWLEKSFGPDLLQAQIDTLDKQIQDQVNPPIVTSPLPWGAK